MTAVVLPGVGIVVTVIGGGGGAGVAGGDGAFLAAGATALGAVAGGATGSTVRGASAICTGGGTDGIGAGGTGRVIIHNVNDAAATSTAATDWTRRRDQKGRTVAVGVATPSVCANAASIAWQRAHDARWVSTSAASGAESPPSTHAANVSGSTQCTRVESVGVTVPLSLNDPVLRSCARLLEP